MGEACLKRRRSGKDAAFRARHAGSPDAASGRRDSVRVVERGRCRRRDGSTSPARRLPGPVLNGRRGSLRQVYVMPALRKPEGRSGKGRAGQGPIMGHYRTGRDARPGTEWGAPAPDLPAGLPQISATLPAACRWLPGAICGPPGVPGVGSSPARTAFGG